MLRATSTTLCAWYHIRARLCLISCLFFGWFGGRAGASHPPLHQPPRYVLYLPPGGGSVRVFVLLYCSRRPGVFRTPGWHAHLFKHWHPIWSRFRSLLFLSPPLSHPNNCIIRIRVLMFAVLPLFLFPGPIRRTLAPALRSTGVGFCAAIRLELFFIWFRPLLGKHRVLMLLFG